MSLVLRNLSRRPLRSSVLMVAVGLMAAMGFLSVVLLAVEPEAPPLPAAVLVAAARLPEAVRVSPQRAVRSSETLGLELGLPHGTTVPLFGIDPARDNTVQPWLDDHRGIDFQDGQVILGHRARGRLGDRLRPGESRLSDLRAPGPQRRSLPRERPLLHPQRSPGPGAQRHPRWISKATPEPIITSERKPINGA
ncbi:MAG: hypothetical protein ACK587_02510 [Cyanobacteriota bacterium]